MQKHTGKNAPNMKQTIISIFIFALGIHLSYEGNAQEIKWYKDLTFGCQIGASNVDAGLRSAGQNPDFMNYLYGSDSWLDFPSIGINAAIEFNNGTKASMRIFTGDELFPENIQLQLGYRLMPFLSLDASFHCYDWLINIDNANHYKAINPEMIYMGYDSDYRQISIYDISFLFGPEFYYQTGALSLSGGLQGGIGKFTSFDDKVTGKKLYSNYIEVYEFDVESDYSFMWSPSANLKIDLFKLSDCKLGFQTNMIGFLGKRGMDYKLTHYEWTMDNSSSSNLEGPIRNFSRWQIEFGIYFKW